MNVQLYADTAPKACSVTKEVTIVAFVTVAGYRIKIATNVRIHPKYWDKAKKQVKKSHPEVVELNHYLSDLKSRIFSKLRQLVTEGNTSTTELKKHLKTIVRGSLNHEKIPDMFERFEEYIEIKKVVLSRNSSKKHVTALNHLKDYSAKTLWQHSFDSIDQNFFENFQRFLIQEKKHLNTTVAKQFNIIKIFLNWAVDKGYTTNLVHRKFRIKEFETEVIHLTFLELMALYYLDLSSNPKLARVRDAFCFQAFTGQRYGDVASLDWDSIDFEGRWWILTSQKTKDKLRIPLNDYALEILGRYRDQRRLPVVSNQKMNQYLKELGRLADINTPFSIVQFRGSERIETKGPKYEFLTSHVARKTFVTLSLAKGMRQETVMAITGHSDYKTMRKYLKITNDMKADEMKDIWSFKEGNITYTFSNTY